MALFEDDGSKFDGFYGDERERQVASRADSLGLQASLLGTMLMFLLLLALGLDVVAFVCAILLIAPALVRHYYARRHGVDLLVAQARSELDNPRRVRRRRRWSLVAGLGFLATSLLILALEGYLGRPLLVMEEGSTSPRVMAGAILGGLTGFMVAWALQMWRENRARQALLAEAALPDVEE